VCGPGEDGTWFFAQWAISVDTAGLDQRLCVSWHCNWDAFSKKTRHVSNGSLNGQIGTATIIVVPISVKSKNVITITPYRRNNSLFCCLTSWGVNYDSIGHLRFNNKTEMVHKLSLRPSISKKVRIKNFDLKTSNLAVLVLFVGWWRPPLASASLVPCWLSSVSRTPISRFLVRRN